MISAFWPYITKNGIGETGTARYMCPEVALHKPYNEKCDVYSFGILLWEMASGKLPFKGT